MQRNLRGYARRNLRKSRFYDSWSITTWLIVINIVFFVIVAIAFPLVEAENFYDIHPFVKENIALSVDNVFEVGFGR